MDFDRILEDFARTRRSGGDWNVKIQTPSGRVFRYSLRTYPIMPDVTPEGALDQAQTIFREKYRYCKWDQKHPEVEVQREIVAAIVYRILEWAEEIREVDGCKIHGNAFWGIFSFGRLVAEFPYEMHSQANARLRTLHAETPGPYKLLMFRRATGDYATLSCRLRFLHDLLCRLRALRASVATRTVASQQETLDGELQAIEAKLKAAEESLPTELIDAYQRTVVRRDADALAPVNDGACMGCFTKITPQQHIHLHLNHELVVCNCGRILYLAEVPVSESSGGVQPTNVTPK